MPQQKVKVLYIAGAGRSGSTLLERVVGQENMFFDAGELRFFWLRGIQENQLCGCGKHLHECSYWVKIIQDITTKSTPEQIRGATILEKKLGRVRSFFSLWTPKSKLEQNLFVKQHLSPLYAELSKIANGKIIIDASKSPSYLYLLSKIDFIDLSVVHIVRDCRAVAFSNSRKKRKPEITDQVVYMKQFSAAWSSAVWLMLNFQILLLIVGKRSKRYMRVSYEDLVSEPEMVARTVFDFVGVKSDLTFFIEKDKVALRSTHTVAGNPMRFKTGTLTIKNDSEWKKEMTLWDKLISTMISLPMILLFRIKKFGDS